MLNHDAADDPRAAYKHHPIDDIEPDEFSEESIDCRLDKAVREAYREAAIKFSDALNSYTFYILNHHNPRVATWVLAYVLELRPVRGKTCEEISSICGMNSRQAFNNEVQDFCGATGYGPSTVMKGQRASAAYREARIHSIIENQKQESE